MSRHGTAALSVAAEHYMLYRRGNGSTTCGPIPEATVIRVPLASASAGVIGLAGLPYRVRRGLVPVLAPFAGVLVPTTGPGPIANLHTTMPSAEPAFRAPWGELERELPYVTITTQPWPEEWWTPAARRRTAATPALAGNAIARATELPSERVAASVVAVPIDAGPRISVAPNAEPEPHIDAPAPSAHRRRDGRRAVRNEAPRRGFLGRVALVAVGLVLSLIAVESASRRRR
jgi:hypothetical protein